MKFVISTQEFNYLISRVLNVVSSKSTIPILSNILIEAKKGHLYLTATDLTVGVRCFTEAKIIEEGATTLPARRLGQLIRELTAVNIEFVTNDNDMTEIIADSSRFKLYGMNKNEYPQLPDLQEAHKFKINQSDLKEALYMTSFAVSREDNRYVLTGVNLSIRNGWATLVGTDGKRLAKTTLKVQAEPQVEGNYIVPLKAVEEIQKNLKDEGEAIVFLMKDKIAVQLEEAIIITKLLTGEYPDVDRVIPQNPELKITLHREELSQLLKQVSLFTQEGSHSVKFTFTPGELKLVANTSEIGEGVVKMPVNYQGNKLDIAFNPNYFMDILRHSKSETVDLGLSDPFNPGIITESVEKKQKEDKGAIFVLMPMRLGEE